MKVRKSDNVVVIAGNYVGKNGKVLKVFREKARPNGAAGQTRVIVEGVNIIKRHTRPSQKNPQGGIVQKEAPIHVSNVMVVCPKCNTPSRLGHAVVTDATSGKRRLTRVCKNCGEMF
jgi:large subunit ribosomal protein L24